MCPIVSAHEVSFGNDRQRIEDWLTVMDLQPFNLSIIELLDQLD
jgi:hypothetical protein